MELVAICSMAWFESLWLSKDEPDKKLLLPGWHKACCSPLGPLLVAHLGIGSQPVWLPFLQLLTPGSLSGFNCSFFLTQCVLSSWTGPPSRSLYSFNLDKLSSSWASSAVRPYQPRRSSSAACHEVNWPSFTLSGLLWGRHPITSPLCFSWAPEFSLITCIIKNYGISLRNTTLGKGISISV